MMWYVIYCGCCFFFFQAEDGRRDLIVTGVQTCALPIFEYQERSQRSEARLLEQFAEASENLIARIGDLIINVDDDERLTLTAAGEFRAEVLTEEENEWRPLKTAEELVEYYDPTDVFGDLADALAEAYPAIAPELAAFEANGTGEAADAAEAEASDGDDDSDDEDDDTGQANGAGDAEDDARR